jgi:PadR family transcriptional regulator PadR
MTDIVCHESPAEGRTVTRELLGELEHRVLLAALHLGDAAYSVSVALHLEDRTGREVELATIQVALKRLEGKGLVRSVLRKAPAEQGGRQRRYYDVTAAGLERLREGRVDGALAGNVGR